MSEAVAIVFWTIVVVLCVNCYWLLNQGPFYGAAFVTMHGTAASFQVRMTIGSERRDWYANATALADEVCNAASVRGALLNVSGCSVDFVIDTGRYNPDIGVDPHSYSPVWISVRYTDADSNGCKKVVHIKEFHRDTRATSAFFKRFLSLAGRTAFVHSIAWSPDPPSGFSPHLTGSDARVLTEDFCSR